MKKRPESHQACPDVNTYHNDHESAAQIYAEIGWRVLPVKRFIPSAPDTEPEPAIDDPRWQVAALVPVSAATTDRDTIEAMWAAFPEADLGLVGLDRSSNIWCPPTQEPNSSGLSLGVFIFPRGRVKLVQFLPVQEVIQPDDGGTAYVA